MDASFSSNNDNPSTRPAVETTGTHYGNTSSIAAQMFDTAPTYEEVAELIRLITILIKYSKTDWNNVKLKATQRAVLEKIACVFFCGEQTGQNDKSRLQARTQDKISYGRYK
uniref:Uncharacterized protein n=1 Tax=Glossina pallidipes TaxID=7398 RepID=A0A1A9Z4M2_GLOPL